MGAVASAETLPHKEIRSHERQHFRAARYVRDYLAPNLLLQQVPEAKRGKNRMHLDIQVLELAPELSRLSGLGARVVWPPHDDNGFLTAVLADPEANEFCVIVPPPGGYDRDRLRSGP
jgi:hypothetical protein